MTLIHRVQTVLGALALAMISAGGALAADDQPYRTVDGLNVYLGVLPSAMKQQQTKSGMPRHAAPPGKQSYHVTVAVFDAASGERRQDIDVRARVAGRGLGGSEKVLLPMTIADTLTYGNFFIMPPNDTYRIQVEIRRPGRTEPVRAEFVYEHGFR